jgi:hypothetical protein
MVYAANNLFYAEGIPSGLIILVRRFLADYLFTS